MARRGSVVIMVTMIILISMIKIFQLLESDMNPWFRPLQADFLL